MACLSGATSVAVLGLNALSVPRTRSRQARPSPGPSVRRARSAVSVRASLINAVPKEYGLVLLTTAASAVLTQWQAIQVAKARKQFDVQYPTMYEEKPDSVFNCYQRAHQNTLENYPAFLAMLLLSGLAYPVVATVCGVVWIAGRVLYSLGYYTGDPKARHKGMWGTFGQLGLLIVTITAGIKQLL